MEFGECVHSRGAYTSEWREEDRPYFSYPYTNILVSEEVVLLKVLFFSLAIKE